MSPATFKITCGGKEPIVVEAGDLVRVLLDHVGRCDGSIRVTRVEEKEQETTSE